MGVFTALLLVNIGFRTHRHAEALPAAVDFLQAHHFAVETDVGIQAEMVRIGFQVRAYFLRDRVTAGGCGIGVVGKAVGFLRGIRPQARIGP